MIRGRMSEDASKIQIRQFEVRPPFSFSIQSLTPRSSVNPTQPTSS